MEELGQKKRRYTKETNVRLIIEMSPEQHCEIKARAALRNVTMRQYVMEAVLKKIHEEKKYD